MFQNIYFIKSMDGIMDNSVTSSQQYFLYDRNASNVFKSSLSEGFPFRGFPESETSTLQCQQQQLDFPSRQLRNNSQNWLDNCNNGEMSYRRYLLNKKCAPVRINTTGESHLCYSSETYQACDDTRAKTYRHADATADLWDNKIFSLLNNVRERCKEIRHDIAVSGKNNEFDVLRTILDNRNATVKRINDDVRKMDVCGDGDQDVVVDADDLLATVGDRLRTSLRSFLKRAQEGTTIELPVFPRTKPCPQVGSSGLIYFTSKDRKPEMSREVLERGRVFAFDVSRDGPAERPRNVITGMPRLGVSDERAKRARANELQAKRDSRETHKLQLQRNIADYVTDEEAVEHKPGCKGDNTEESIHRCKMMGSRLQNVINPESTFQALSASQLVAYKKRYYDTLSVQRAKVTNSLASSGNLTVRDTACCSNTCHRQDPLHRQRRFATRIPQCSTALPGLSSLRSSQHGWARSDCKYLLLKQLRLRQTSPLQHSRNQSD